MARAAFAPWLHEKALPNSGALFAPVAYAPENDHGAGEQQHPPREKLQAYLPGNEPEQRRHERGSKIGCGHLQGCGGLACCRAEALGCFMDNAGIDGRTAQTEQRCRCAAYLPAGGEEHQQRREQHHRAANADEGLRAVADGEEAVEATPNGDAHEEQTGCQCGLVAGTAAQLRHVAGCPQRGGGLDCAVAEKGGDDGLDAGQAQRLGIGHDRRGLSIRCGCILTGSFAPQRQGNRKNDHQHSLNADDDEIACAPALMGGHAGRKNQRPGCCTHAPETVQPGHVLCGIVQGNVIVQRRIHAAGAKTQRDGAQK